ncbi:MAG: DUF3093 domain-containing protein [Mycobacteriales bacterium]
MRYKERLSTPWWWYPTGVIVAVFLGYEVGVTFYVVMAAVGTLVLIALLAPLLLGRHRVQVSDTHLIVDRTRIPLRSLGPPQLRTGALLRRRLGVDADPAAHACVCPWIKTAVEFPVEAADSPVPYWLVSTRNPTQLAAAVAQPALADLDPKVDLDPNLSS